MLTEMEAPTDLQIMFDNAPSHLEGLVREDATRIFQFMPGLQGSVDQIHLVPRDVFTHAVLASKGMEDNWLHSYYASFTQFALRQKGYTADTLPYEAENFKRQLNDSRRDTREAGAIFQASQGNSVLLSFGLPHIQDVPWWKTIAQRKWSDAISIADEIVAHDMYMTSAYDDDPWFANIRVFNRSSGLLAHAPGEDISGFSGQMLRAFTSRLDTTTRRKMHESDKILFYTVEMDRYEKKERFTVFPVDRFSEPVEHFEKPSVTDGIVLDSQFAAYRNWNGTHRVYFGIGESFFHAELIAMTPNTRMPKRVRYLFVLRNENQLEAKKILAPMGDYQRALFMNHPWSVSHTASPENSSRAPITVHDIDWLRRTLQKFYEEYTQLFPADNRIVGYFNAADYLITQCPTVWQVGS